MPADDAALQQALVDLQTAEGDLAQHGYQAAPAREAYYASSGRVHAGSATYGSARPPRDKSATLTTMSLLHQALDRWAERQPEALFALEAGRQMSYAEAAAATRRIAAGLRSAGLPPRARMAILAKNRIEVVLLYYAASRAGVTVVPLNTRLAADELAYIFGDAEPHVVFVDEPFVDVVDRLRAGQTLHAARFVALDPSAARRSGWESFETWLAHDPKRGGRAAARLRTGDLFQLYTSATTGRPKGAVLTQRAVCANIAQIGEAISEVAGERSLVVAPLFHAAMVPSTLAPLAQGGSVYVQSEFRPPEVARVLDEERIGFAVLVPAMLLGMLSGVPDLATRRFEALRLIYYGSSPIAEPTLRTAMDTFGCGFMQSYGMTEATQAVTFLTPEDHLRALAGHSDLLLSAGRPAPHTEIEIVDAMDARLPVGHPGESRRAWPAAHARVLEAAAGHRGHAPRWLAPQRRHRHARRRGLSDHQRPAERHDRLRRRKRLSASHRRGARRASSRCRGRRDRGATPALGGDRQGHRGPARRNDTGRRGVDGLLPRTPGWFRGPALGRHCSVTPSQCGWESAQARAA